MNKTIVGLSLLLATQTAIAADGNFTVKAELKNFGDTVVAMIPQGKTYHRDTILVKNNKFTATLHVDEPKDIFFPWRLCTVRRTNSYALWLFPERPWN